MNKVLWKHSTLQIGDEPEWRLYTARRHQKFLTKCIWCALWGSSGVLIMKNYYKSNLFPKRNIPCLLYTGQLQKFCYANFKYSAEQGMGRRTGQGMKGMRKSLRESEQP